MLKTCLIQTVVISNVELCQLGSAAGNLNEATGSEVCAGVNAERLEFWEKFGQL
jgi:hypothetical protein